MKPGRVRDITAESVGLSLIIGGCITFRSALNIWYLLFFGIAFCVITFSLVNDVRGYAKDRRQQQELEPFRREALWLRQTALKRLGGHREIELFNQPVTLHLFRSPTGVVALRRVNDAKVRNISDELDDDGYHVGYHVAERIEIDPSGWPATIIQEPVAVYIPPDPHHPAFVENITSDSLPAGEFFSIEPPRPATLADIDAFQRQLEATRTTSDSSNRPARS